MALVQQLIHLELSQKKALLKRKLQGKGSISDQIRTAANMYLDKGKETDDEELQIVMDFAKQAEITILDMSDIIDQMNDKLDSAFAEIERLRKKRK